MTSIDFRPTAEDERTLREVCRPDESGSDILRRVLHLLGIRHWLDQFHSDAAALTDDNANAEPEAW